MDDVVIVVAGHDKYSTAWPAMMHGIRKYLTIDWPIYWITNHLNAPKGCKTVQIGGDFNPKRWSNRMIKGLEQVPAKTILWLLDDHWLIQKPDMPAMQDFAKMVQDGYIDRLRLYPGLDHDFGKIYSLDARLIIMNKKSPYRCSCKPSFWNRKVLRSLLRDGESPWDFERKGRKRSTKYRFAVTKDWHFFFVTTGCPGWNGYKSPLVKAWWTKSAKTYAEREGLKMDFTKHPARKNPFGKNIPDWVLP